MAEPMTSMDIGAAVAVVGALVTVIVTLWKWGQTQVQNQRTMFAAQVQALEKEGAARSAETRDLVERVRSLEASRVNDLKEHSEKMAGLVLRSFEEGAQNRAVLRDIARILNARPCLSAHSDGKVPEPSSDRTYYQRSRERHERQEHPPTDALEKRA